MDFDVKVEEQTPECVLEYGIVRGNQKIVFVKSGNGGSYRGYEDKYVRFAEYLHSKNGCSVICASNPMESRRSDEADMAVICKYIAERGFSEAELYLWGNSDGCFKAIELALRLNVKKTVLVNMPLMINFYRTKEKLKTLEDAGLVFVYGDGDPSVKYIPFLESLGFGKFVMLENTKHRIKGTNEQNLLFADLLFE